VFDGCKYTGDICVRLGIGKNKRNRDLIKNKMATLGLSFPRDMAKPYERKIKTKQCNCGCLIKDSSTMCLACLWEKNRKYDRPSYEELYDFLLCNNRVSTALRYGVHRNVVSKWMKYYEDQGKSFVVRKMKLCSCGAQIMAKSKSCYDCMYKRNMKVERPSFEALKKELEESNYCAVGKKYGVSDNAVRKWMKAYKRAESVVVAIERD
jgi:transposase-like protein